MTGSSFGPPGPLPIKQQQFEAQRSKKQREIEQKLASSEKNKTRNLNHIQEKFHKISLRHQKVFIKIQDENLKQLQKNYDSRRAYDIETSRRSSKLINSSQHTSTDERHKSVKDYKTKTLQHEQIRNKMNEIDKWTFKTKDHSQKKKLMILIFSIHPQILLSYYIT